MDRAVGLDHNASNRIVILPLQNLDRAAVVMDVTYEIPLHFESRPGRATDTDIALDFG